MSAKKSAYSVFKETGGKSSQDLPGDGVLMREKHQPKLKGTKRRKSSSFSSLNEGNTSKLGTPDIAKAAKRSLKAESPLFSSLRKSLRKKPKKESHHDVSLKQGGKENKLSKAGSYLQVFERSNWTESLEGLNSSYLEAAFLPEVVKEKKKQKALHGNFAGEKDQLRSISASDIAVKGNDESEPRQRTLSCTTSSLDSSLKPPIPKNAKAHASKNHSSHKKMDSDLQNSDGASKPEMNQKILAVEGTIPDSKKLLQWLISPVKSDQFFREVWQKKPLFIKRRQPKYNNVWFSCKEFDRVLRQENVHFTKNIDIARYRDGQRETLNPNGRALAPVVWNFYEEGCSIRFLNPQTFSKNVWHLSSRLQEHFGCFVGCNAYLTPPGSQGFAPHYDDIEAFVIQLEGKKRWKIHSSRNMNEVLARHSSPNFSQEELGEPILDRVLEAGDTLYFPRGVIHQGITLEDSHSLHITLSFCQKTTWSEYMEKLIPMALHTAITEDVEFRKALPIGFHNHVGISCSEQTSEQRKSFMKKVEELMKKLTSYVSVDQVADEVVLDQMEEFLPPSLTTEEKECTAFENGAFWDDGKVSGQAKLSLDSKIRLVRPGIARLVTSDDQLQIHHTLGNSRQYKEMPLQVLEVSLELADAVEYFLLSYPTYVTVKDAPLDSNNEKLSLAMKLYQVGLLRTKTP